MVFQSDALFDSMSVLDNVLLPLRKQRVPLSEAHQVFFDWLLERAEPVGGPGG